VTLAYTQNSTVANLTVINGYAGISLTMSQGNRLIRNRVAECLHGLYFTYSSDNSVFYNDIESDNYYNFNFGWSSNNSIFHNNFLSNYTMTLEESFNLWDNGYPSGGNYWRTYHGVDRLSGPNQDQAGSDGVGDTPHIIGGGNQDNYPFMSPITFFDTGTWNNTQYTVDVSSNSTLADFHFNASEGAFLRLVVQGANGTQGFCRVAIPTDILWTENSWVVTVDGSPIEYARVSSENCTYLFFIYDHSTKTITIEGTHVVPEFPSPVILLLFTASILAYSIVFRHSGSRQESF